MKSHSSVLNHNSQNNSLSKAIIYCRVSSTKQTKQGNGLSSQQTRCEEYAKYKGYDIVKTFSDDMSGAVTTRPGMKAMLTYLRKRRTNPHVVIIDDISRLARSIEAHLQLRSAINNAGGVLESPSLEFGDDCDSVLVENMLASVSQHQRQKNAQQTKDRMRARTMSGYWVFQAPVGYKYEHTRGHGKILVRDEPIASILQEALEGYASGRFESQVEFKRFLDNNPLFPKNTTNGELRFQQATDLLKRVVYSGYIDVPNWNISLRKGQHEGLISYETHERIQKRLTQTGKAPARKNLSNDFPLRGFVLCGDCEKPLTACWSKGKNKHYPYYLCSHKGCSSKGKSIPRKNIENDFAVLLKTLQPTKIFFKLVSTMFKDAWGNRSTIANQQSKTLRSKQKSIETKIGKLVDRIVDSESRSVVTAYEKKILTLEKEKVSMNEKIKNNGKPQHTFEEMFEHCMEFLSNPYKLWASKRLEHKRVALKLAFSQQLPYCKKKGFRTPKLSLPFKVLSDFKGGKKQMVRPTGFEPVTFAFGGFTEYYACKRANRQRHEPAFNTDKSAINGCRY